MLGAFFSHWVVVGDKGLFNYIDIGVAPALSAIEVTLVLFWV
jgi:hypothetical protein